MKKIEMIIKELKASKINKFYDMILLEKDGARAINISIGEHEADSIALFLDKIPIPRLMTYELCAKIMQNFGINVKEVVINKFFEGSFFADITVSDQNKEQTIQIRPSDAINLALRFDCPIYVTEDIVEMTGFDYCKLLNDTLVQASGNTIDDIDNLSIFGKNMLQDLLKDAIEKEDYITASILRDKINKIENE